MSNLSELLPAGAGAKSAEFVASGTLGSGVTVALQSDGTVKAITSDAVSVPESVGSKTTIEASITEDFGVAYDIDNNKVVVSYTDRDNSDYGTYAVGTISGTSISFGTPGVFQSAATTNNSLVYDPDTGQIIFVSVSGAASGKSVVGTVSGTSISFGTSATYEANPVYWLGATYVTDQQKVFIAYRRTNNDIGYGVVGTVSGTSISFGSPVQFSANRADYVRTTYAGSSKVVVVYKDFGNNQKGAAIVGTISGTSVSFGTQSFYDSSFPCNYNNIAYDPVNDKVLVIYYRSYGKGVVGTISGTSISFGSDFDFDQTNVQRYGLGIVYSALTGTFVIVYPDASSSNEGYYVQGTISGTNVSFTSRTQLTTTEFDWGVVTIDNTTAKPIVVWSDDSLGYATSLVIQLAYTASNNTDFIGITDQAIADTATGAVIVQGGVASGVTLPYYYSFGTSVVFDNQLYTDALTSTYDSNSNKVVISYSDSGNSGYVTVVVGTVSGSNISFGTPVVAASTNASWLASTFDSSANKVVAAYRTATDTGEAVVGTVSGTSISFGSAAQFESGRNSYTVATFDSSNNKVIIAYQDNFNSDYGTIVVGTVSGTSISFGSPVVFNSATTYYPGLTFDSNEGKVVLGYRDGSNGNAGTALIGTVSGTSISFGSSAVFQSGTTSWIAATFDSNSNKVLFTYANSTAGKVAVGTVSGTSISFGTPVTFDTGNSNQFVTTFDSNLNQVFIVYRDQSNSTYGTIIAATISGTTATFSDAQVFAAVTVNVPQIVFDSNANKTVVSYVDTAATGSGTSIVTNFTNTLAVTSDYYVQADGTLSTTVSSVPAGRALSTTSILLEG